MSLHFGSSKLFCLHISIGRCNLNDLSNTVFNGVVADTLPMHQEIPTIVHADNSKFWDGHTHTRTHAPMHHASMKGLAEK